MSTIAQIVVAFAALVRPMAYNQGFYNLFLAAGAVTGLVLYGAGRETAGTTAAVFACACMAGAGLVLFSTDRRFLTTAAAQTSQPLLAIVLIAVTRVSWQPRSTTPPG